MQCNGMEWDGTEWNVMSACVCVHACMQLCMYAYMHVCMYACMCVFVFACVCVCMCVCTYARTYASRQDRLR